MAKYFIKESFNDDIPASVFKVYRRRFFGLLRPEYIDWFLYENQTRNYIDKLTNLPNRDKTKERL